MTPPEIESTAPPPDAATVRHANAAACEVRVFRSEAEIEEVRDIWMRWHDDPNADIDFYLLINRTRKNVVRPHIILVSCGGRPKAMAIGRIERGLFNIKFGYKRLAHFPVVTLHIIFGGLLGEQTQGTSVAILNSLKESLRDGEAEMLVLSFVPVGSEIVKRLPEEVSFLCRDHFTEKQVHWKMALGCTVEEMYAGLSRDHRQQVRKKARAFERDFPGGLSIRCFQKPEELDQMMGDVEEVAKMTYQRGLGVGFMDNEENRRRVVFEAGQGWLRVYVLYLNGKPCAYWQGLIYNNTLYGAAMGFDTQYRDYSPGNYLLHKTLEDWCKQGVKALDFGLGDARYKQQFGNQHWYETSVRACAPRPRLIAMFLINSLIHRVEGGVLAIARRFNAVEFIKKRWRAKLAPTKDKAAN